jgi:hypothetical protein
MLMPRAEHNQLLRDLLAQPLPGVKTPGTRVFLGGSPLDHSQLYELIEAAGGTVVAEDHSWGNPVGELLTETTGDPLNAIAARFHRKPSSAVSFPLSEEVARCANRAVKAGAEVAIFSVLEVETAKVWEVPDEMRALAEQGVPSLYLKNQPYWSQNPEELKERIASFLGEAQNKAVTA